MKRVYICSPRGQLGRHTATDNAALAQKLCQRAAFLGYAPFTPYFYAAIDASEQKKEAASIAWLAMSDEIWIWAEDPEECSDSMLEEIARAKRFSISPIARWMPDEFLGVKWHATGEIDLHCKLCSGTGKIVKEDESQRKCRLCIG